MDPKAIVTNPFFLLGVFHAALVSGEKAAPDYTVFHRAAKAIDQLFGWHTISTPTAAAAEPVASAVAEALGGAITAAVATAAQQEHKP